MTDAVDREPVRDEGDFDETASEEGTGIEAAGDAEEVEAEDVEEIPADRLLGVLEAVLFAAEEPLNESTLAQTIPGLIEARVPALIDALEQHYIEDSHGLTVQRVAGGWRLATRAEYAEYVRNHLRSKLRNRLSRAALETVSIIAYRQPISRSEIEQMRGVDCSPVLRHLLERNLVRITGRADAPGRPLLYGTSDSFLEYFGLESLNSLPKAEEILGEPEEEQSGQEMPIRRGPFAGRDPGIELETYRFSAPEPEDDLPEEAQGPVPGGNPATTEDPEDDKRDDAESPPDGTNS